MKIHPKTKQKIKEVQNKPGVVEKLTLLVRRGGPENASRPPIRPVGGEKVIKRGLGGYPPGTPVR
jgi:hypothetical protein